MQRSTAEQNAGPKRRFGVFEYDPQARELTKHGVRLKLQEQPVQILAALLEQAGQIVPREELQRRLWPDGTFVDYEQSLNKAVNKLREALGDSADHPIYIETLSRRGYRFVAPVERDEVPEPAVSTVAPAPPAPALRRRALPWVVAGGCALAVVLATGLWPIHVPLVERVVPLTGDTTRKLGTIFSDGNKVLYSDSDGVFSVAVSGGKPTLTSLDFLPKGWMNDLTSYSPIREQIVVTSHYSSKPGLDELWLSGTGGESPRKICDVPRLSRIALAPNTERLALSTPGGIYILSINSGERKKIRPMSGIDAVAVWWHPSGRVLGFLDNPDDRKMRAWQMNDDGTNLRRIVPESDHEQGPGAWSRDGSRFFYTSEGEVFVRIQTGFLGWMRKAVVTRLTASGQFGDPLAIDPINPRRLYALGTVQRGQTMRYDSKAHRWVPFLGDFSGDMIDFSPDRQSMVYILFPGFELHKCKRDGSGNILLAPGVEARNPRWSPDGKRIAFPGRPHGTLGRRKLWLVSAAGGDAAPYRPEIAVNSDTIWSRDGKRLLLDLELTPETPRGGLRILDLETGKLETIPGSEGLFSPRWSPDEKQILALGLSFDSFYILDLVKGAWRPFPKNTQFGWPLWSRDAKYIYGAYGFHMVRAEVATGRREVVGEGGDFELTGNVPYWGGWTPDWDPLRIRDLSSTQIYRIDLDR